MASTRFMCFVSVLLEACLVLFSDSVEAVDGSGIQPQRNYQGCLQKCRDMNTARDVACANFELDTIPNATECRRAFVLDLKNNNIKELLGGVFTGFIDLTTLLLNDNKIIDISLDVFQDLESLEALHLARNNLTSLRKGVFDGLDSLSDRLILTENQITQITTRVFNTLTLIRILSLDHNLIENIEAGSFDGMAQLTHLFLTKNRISRIASGTFNGLGELQILDLSENHIETLEGGAFGELDSLKQLILNSNRITAVASIVDLPGLDILTLADNEIESLGDNQFIRGKLEEHSFTITTQENPLYCNCSIEMLSLWYRNHETADEATCAAPEKYASIRLGDIEELIWCPSQAAVDISTNNPLNEVGNHGRIGNDPNSIETTTAVIVSAGVIILIISVFVVIRKYRMKTRHYNDDKDEYQTQSSTQNEAPSPHLANGYSTFVPREEDDTKTSHAPIESSTPHPPPNVTGHIFWDTEPQDDSQLLPPQSTYISVDEINHQPLSGEPNKRSKMRNGRPQTSTPKQDAKTPPRSLSLSPDPVCEFGMSKDGKMVLTPGPMFDDDDMSSNCQDSQAKEVQYASLNHCKPSRDSNPPNHSLCYIAPRDLGKTAYVT